MFAWSGRTARAKTTTIRMLCRLLKPTSGKPTVLADRRHQSPATG